MPHRNSTQEIWGFQLDATQLSERERSYLATLPDETPSIEWVWNELDRVWTSLGLDNRRPLSDQRIDEFYAHPVWIMNGVFSALDPTSASHRQAMAMYISSHMPQKVADYGGGFGELARKIVQESDHTTVSIVERYPSSVAQALVGREDGIRFVPELGQQEYDVVVAQDVLEHVEQPVELALRLAEAARPGGLVIYANNFTPVIRCHLPRTFHLRHTFRSVMMSAGLMFEGKIEGADHAHVYRVPDSLRAKRARAAEQVSKVVGPLLMLAAKAGLGRLLRSFRPSVH